ncbi:MAG: hypothetical protein ACK5QX_11285 [bacterium]|jgi:hypothetical protein
MSGVEFPLRIPLEGKNLDKLIMLLNKAGKEANLTEKEIADIEKQLKKVGQEGPNHINKVNQSMDNFVSSGIKKVGAAMLAAFAIDRVIAFGKAVVDITAEFQKAEAVLTNTLGSKSAAQIALINIQKFAEKTPFSVQQLTNSFVKLANQGFVPTTEELRKLGDIAASTGKDFDQLAEAIIDAQTGEFERLKEFGIRASKEGDRVTFTFKGVQTQTEFTSQAIRDYVLSLGDAAGVSGSMAAISETLGGKISNMGDAWDNFMRVLGDQNSGPLSNAVRNLTLLINLATEWVETNDQARERLATIGASQNLENFKALARSYDDVNKAAEDYIRILDIQADLALKEIFAVSKKEDATEAEMQAVNLKRDTILATITTIQDYVKEVNNSKKATDGSTKATKEEIEALKKKREEHAKANKQWEGVVDREIQEAKIQEELTEKQKKQNAEKQIYWDIIEGIKDAEKEFYDEDQKRLEESNALLKKDREQKLKDEKQYLDGMLQNRLEFNDYVRDAAQGLANELFELDQARFEAEMQSLEMARNREIELAGDNAEAKRRINRKYDEEQRKLKQKQAQSDKDQALFNILVNTAQGVMAALASVPPNVPLSVAIGFTGAAQAAIVSSRPLPKFAKGVYDLQGPGTTTSDSIMAMLSAHESVVPAKQSQKYGWLLKPLIEEDLSLLELKNLVDQNIPVGLRGDLFQTKTISDSSLVASQLDRVVKAIEGKKEMHIDIDENGFKAWARKNNQWSQYVSNRYKF